MNIISRETWGARHPDGFDDAPLPASEVWLHHSATVAPDLFPPFDDEDQAVRQLEAIGQSRFGGGISYTFAVMPTGRVYEGHSVGREGAHTRNRNSRARGIVLVGNYEGAPTTGQQREAVAQLLAHGWRSGWWTAPRLNGGHRQVVRTACPGQLGMDAIPLINDRAADLAAGSTEGDGFLSALSEDEQRQLLRMVGRVDYMLLPGEGPYQGPRGDYLTKVGAMHALIIGQGAALNTALKLLAAQNGITVDDFRQVLREEIAAGVDVDVTVSSG